MSKERSVEDYLEDIIGKSNSFQEKTLNETILSLYKIGFISARYNEEISDWQFKLTEDGNKSFLLDTTRMITPAEA